MIPLVRITLFLLALPLVGAFTPSQQHFGGNSLCVSQPSVQYPLWTDKSRQLSMASNEDITGEVEEAICWSPQLRRVVASMASLGALETAYLTYTKLTGASQAFCGTDGGCNSVLSGPYASIPFTEIPLAALGFGAYSFVAILALQPLASQRDDTENRIWLTAATTTMGTFSVFLMSLLFGVLHATCPFCILSAFLSIGMAGLVWIGGCLPDEDRQRGVQTSAGSFAISVFAALVLFFSTNEPGVATQFAGSPGGRTTDQTLVASSEGFKPPPITTESTKRTMSLANQLQALDARMYGAILEALGKAAFSKLTYVECSKDGYNQQNALCKESGVPGYPTWIIQGKLYPGEQTLEELEEIVQEASK